ncbi:hypothetical protein [Streptomyces sp. NPDC057381]|uniref:hypothetical protein n=1 Tax=Streptomyces sp. NPDC057381 TaxID=3346111 RepID=UPI00363A6E08
MTRRSEPGASEGFGQHRPPPEPKTPAQQFGEDLGCAGLFALLAGAPAALALMDWRPLLVFPTLLLVQPAMRILGPLLRGRRRLGQTALVVAWSVGVTLSAVMVCLGANLMSDIDPSCDPSEGSTCNLVIDGRVVGEADASDAQGERFQNIMISLSVILLGAIPLCILLWNGYRALRRRA